MSGVARTVKKVFKGVGKVAKKALPLAIPFAIGWAGSSALGSLFGGGPAEAATVAGGGAQAPPGGAVAGAGPAVAGGATDGAVAPYMAEPRYLGDGRGPMASYGTGAPAAGTTPATGLSAGASMLRAAAPAPAKSGYRGLLERLDLTGGDVLSAAGALLQGLDTSEQDFIADEREKSRQFEREQRNIAYAPTPASPYHAANAQAYEQFQQRTGLLPPAQIPAT